MIKFGLIIEYDLKSGMGGHFARLKEGDGDVALFDTKEELMAWANTGEDVDLSCFDYGIVELEIE